MKKYILPILLLIISYAAENGYSMATEQIGPNSTLGHPPGIQPQWPKGIFEISNLESRVYSIDVNGNENIYFKATIEEINEIISLFSKARMRDHIVRIRAGKGKTQTFQKIEIEYNVQLQIVGGIVLSVARENPRDDLPLEPELTILTGDDNSLLSKLKWPENLIVESEIPGVSINPDITEPKRDVYYGLCEFADGSPPVEFVKGVNSRVTLWEQGEPNGINIGRIDNKGYCKLLFSDTELDDLRKDKTWLTITIGNWLVEAKKNDMRLPVEMLVKDMNEAKPVKVKGLDYYYGRILFEDGSPAVLDKTLWKGAEIMVDFPYAGPPEIDSQGYFKINFTEEQFKQAKARKVRNNIYIPDSQDTSRARATYAFPAEQLSQDKSKAGVVKIPRPKPPKQELSKAESKIGKSIPGFEKITFEAFQSEQAKDKALLVCFWDFDQRPSRQCIQSLEKQKDALLKKNIVVLAVHSGKKPEKEFRQWLKENNISLVCGTIEGDPYDTLLAWGARGLPWLILTDAKHIITKAGFNIEDLT
ncbi:MAG: hypothetical protein JW715_16415 [Sedimentisphaerales bacterium]|nr:hypothetical protein [Sedimentisphaerales bacterium]